jgi:hypothetical protein
VMDMATKSDIARVFDRHFMIPYSLFL